jgi:Uma2 family endonuclease
MSAIPQYTEITQRKYSVAEYFSLEKELSESLYEFSNGEIISRAGGTDTHNEIAGNMYIAFRNAVKGGKCKVYMNDVKLEVLRNKKYYYPDVFVTCSEADLESPNLKKEAKIVVEVLSDSTENNDRLQKQIDYLTMSSLDYYIRVSQKTASVEVYERKNDFFAYKIYTDLQAQINLGELGFLSLENIYENITLNPENTTVE